MLKYRVLNKKTNEFLANEGISLSQDGVISQNGQELSGDFELHLDMDLKDSKSTPIYMGDAFSTVLDKEDNPVVYYLLADNLAFLPKKYDEVIIQIAHDDPMRIYYYVFFKLNGRLVLNKECEGLKGMDNDEVRAIPTDSLSLLSNLALMKSSEVLYNCTSEKWIKLI